MGSHSDTLSWFRVNQSLLLLLNTVCLAGKYQFYRPLFDPTMAQTQDLLHSRPNHGPNPRSTALKAQPWPKPKIYSTQDPTMAQTQDLLHSRPNHGPNPRSTALKAQPWPKPKIYCTQGPPNNHYTTNTLSRNETNVIESKKILNFVSTLENIQIQGTRIWIYSQ